MATLTGNTVQSTYESLIKIGDNSSGFGTLKQLSDGLGNLMPIEFSSTVIDFTTATTADFTGVNVLGLPASDTTYDLSSAQDGSNVDIDLVGSDATTDTVKLVAGTGITLTDNGANQVTVASTATGGVTSLEGLTGALDLVGTQNLTVTDNGSDTITLTGYDDTPVTTNAANIATNTTDIATNTSDIATNTTDIATNAGDITTNSNNILFNAGNIASNAANITAIQNAGYVDTSGSPLGSYVAYFSDADTITGESTFSYSAANNRLDVENINTTEELRTQKYMYFTLPAVNQASGELADFGSFPAAPALLRMYYFDSTGFWIAANNTALGTTRGILGVALSNTEVLLRGYVRTTQSFTRGQELWLASNGTFATTQPSGGDFARIVGHAVSVNTVYFNPSQEYIETT